MHQGVHKADKDQKKIVYTIFYPQTTKTKELSFVFFRLRTSPQAIYIARLEVWMADAEMTEGGVPRDE